MFSLSLYPKESNYPGVFSWIKERQNRRRARIVGSPRTVGTPYLSELLNRSNFILEALQNRQRSRIVGTSNSPTVFQIHRRFLIAGFKNRRLSRFEESSVLKNLRCAPIFPTFSIICITVFINQYYYSKNIISTRFNIIKHYCVVVRVPSI